MQDLAPSASARTTSMPVRMPPSNMISICEPTASTISGSTSIEDGAPSSWRPPWLETTMACAPVLAASSASSTSRMPFRISLPGQIERIQSMSFQFSEVSNCDAVHSDSLMMSSVPLTWPAMLPKAAALAAQHAGDPGRLAGEIDQFRQRPFRRHRHAVLDVLVALPDHLQIDGQHQRRAFRRDRALDQRLDEAAVLHDVELEPERLVDGGCDVLDRADRHRALGEGNAGGLRGAAGVDLAVAMLHAEQADRGQDQRHRGGLAEDRGGEVALGDVDQDALAELDLLPDPRNWRAACPRCRSRGRHNRKNAFGTRRLCSWRRSSMQVMCFMDVPGPSCMRASSGARSC